jgi:hypothetical protein
MQLDAAPRSDFLIVTVVDMHQVRDAVLFLRCATIRAIAAAKDVLDRMAPPSPAEVRHAP